MGPKRQLDTACECARWPGTGKEGGIREGREISEDLRKSSSKLDEFDDRTKRLASQRWPGRGMIAEKGGVGL